MRYTALLRGDKQPRRAVKVLVVECDDARRDYLTDALAMLAEASTVMSVTTATEARRAIESSEPSGEPWFVVCGLSAQSWSTLVLLEWIRERAQRQWIETALLTDTVAELLPLAVVDSRPRVMAASPSPGELRAWVRLTAAASRDTPSPQPEMTGRRG